MFLRCSFNREAVPTEDFDSELGFVVNFTLLLIRIAQQHPDLFSNRLNLDYEEGDAFYLSVQPGVVLEDIQQVMPFVFSVEAASLKNRVLEHRAKRKKRSN